MARPFRFRSHSRHRVAQTVNGARLWGVTALCVLSGSGWLLHQAWPSEMQWPFGSCLHFALLGLWGITVSALREEWRGLSLRRFAALGAAGMCLFAVPTAGLHIAAGKVPEYTSTALFCGIPLMTILAAGASGEDEGSQLRGFMVPATIGLAGALLLFPVQSPGSLRQWLFLGMVLGCCVAVAVASVLMHRLMRDTGVAAAVAVVGLGSATVLGCYGALDGWPRFDPAIVAGELLRCVVFDLPVIWITIWLSREVAPARLSARFLLVPLVTVIEGYGLERGPVDTRAILAVVLLCGGGVILLFRDAPEEVPGLRLR